MDSMAEFELQLAALPPNFVMYSYKIDPCPNPEGHSPEDCVWAHPQDHHSRRHPSLHAPVYCKSMRSKHVCFLGDACPKAHTLQEYRLHPSRFRTERCRYGSRAECPNPLCFFAHTDAELRAPSPAVGQVHPQLSSLLAASGLGGQGSTGSPHLTVAASAADAVAPLLLQLQQQAANDGQLAANLQQLLAAAGRMDAPTPASAWLAACSEPALSFSAMSGDSSASIRSSSSCSTMVGPGTPALVPVSAAVQADLLDGAPGSGCAAPSGPQQAMLSALQLGDHGLLNGQNGSNRLVLMLDSQDGNAMNRGLAATLGLNTQAQPLQQLPCHASFAGQASPAAAAAAAAGLIVRNNTPPLLPVGASAAGGGVQLLQAGSHATQQLLQGFNGQVMVDGSTLSAMAAGGGWGTAGLMQGMQQQPQLLSVTPNGNTGLAGLLDTPAGGMSSLYHSAAPAVAVQYGGSMQRLPSGVARAPGGTGAAGRVGRCGRSTLPKAPGPRSPAAVGARGRVDLAAAAAAGLASGAGGGAGQDGQLGQLVQLMLRTLNSAELRSVHNSIGASLRSAQ